MRTSFKILTEVSKNTILLLILGSLILQGCFDSEDLPKKQVASPQQAASKSRTPTTEQKTISTAAREGQEPTKRRQPIVQQDKKSQETAKGMFNSQLPRLADIDSGVVSVEEISGFKTPAEYLRIASKRFPENIVAVTLPLDYDRDSAVNYPLVIAFGGFGECTRPPRDGALAWLHYYKTDEAITALANNKLAAGDFRGLVTNEHLNNFNTRLKRDHYGGVILACPASPPLSPQSHLEFPDYEAFIMEELIPTLKNRYKVAPGKIGVDGVSMGGSRSMYYGFKYPEIFYSIGSVQGAFGPHFDAYRDLLAKNKDILKKRVIQLVTSDRDTMVKSVERLHALLLAEDIPHDYLKLTGPHDYIFNQGPGALALLIFHDHALRMPLRGPVKK
ncbi:MAG: alpha/beta hydrolase [Desulfomonilaceae bacterium]